MKPISGLPSSVRTALAGAVLAGAVLLTFLGGLRAPFLFDDYYNILDNPSLASPGASLFPPGELPVRDRPLFNLTLALNRALGGYDPAGYRLLNILLHAGAAWALFGLIRRTLNSPVIPETWRERAGAASFAAALLWALHPLQTASVTYISQRSEILSGLFYLLTLYGFARSRQGGNPKFWAAGSVTACALGMLTKATAVTAPVLVYLYDQAFFPPGGSGFFRGRKRYYLALAACWGIQGAILLNTEYPDIVSWGPFEYASAQPGVVLRYLRLVFFPSGLCFDYLWTPPQIFWGWLLPALPLGLLLALTVAGSLRRKPLSFLGIWFFLLLLPTSSFLPLEDPAFEHRTYLPLAAPATGAVLAAWAALEKLLGRKKGLVAFGILVALLAGGEALATRARNRLYLDPVRLWEATAFQRPLSWRARYNLGRELSERLDPRAGDAYRQALALNPGHRQSWNNLGNELAREGKFPEAAEAYERARELDPESPEILNNLGRALGKAGRLEEAIVLLEEAVVRYPATPEAYYNLGWTLLQAGRDEEAEKALARSVRLRPGYSAAWQELERVYRRRGRIEAAAAAAQRARQAAP